MLLCLHLLLGIMACKQKKQDLNNYPVYEGNDLGVTYAKETSAFRIWSPVATNAELLLYTDNSDAADKVIAMEKAEGGTWKAFVQGDLKGRLYAFRVKINGKWSAAVPDPYAIATGVNGKKGMVVDISETNPHDWAIDTLPSFGNATDAIIYELHIRDATIAANSGVKNKGKFLGLTEEGTKNNKGHSTGIDHIKEMGVTHVQLLPFFDFLSIDETKLDTPQYNWGYEPLNYNVPEGSYATNPYDGISRIKELKQLIKTFHDNGLRVVMDVVYNHTMLTKNSWFNELVPDYYYRQDKDGNFSDATACGNETASERYMVRKFILESLLFWVKEYRIDGFRFDLMGVHDTETMNLIAKELRKVKPGILLYGEGWTAKESPFPEKDRALKKNASLLSDIGVFSDDIRDGIKGSVFVEKEKGFVSGQPAMEESIKFGVAAAVKHPQVDYTKVNYSKAPYATHPSNTITYAECHDNHILWDKLKLSAPANTDKERISMHKLAHAIVLTAQGIPFLHAGSEFLRTKKGNENSYNAGDSINEIDWDLKSQYHDVVDYIRALIRLRKDHPAFRMLTGEQVAKNIRFLDVPATVVAFELDGKALGDTWSKILVVYNANNSIVNLPGNSWKQFLLPGQESSLQGVGEKQTLTISPISCQIFYKE